MALIKLNLTDREMDALAVLAGNLGKSKRDVLRQSLRLYEFVAPRLEAGDGLFLGNEKGVVTIALFGSTELAITPGPRVEAA